MKSETGFLVSVLVVLRVYNVVGDDNFICSQAVRISPDGDTVYGTKHSNPDDLDNFDDLCASYWDYETNSSAWWYVISGTGGLLNADTRSNATNFDTVISIYRGDCGNLECVGRNDDFTSSASAISWTTEEDVDYYIRVYGYEGETGDFRLEVTLIEPVINDDCDGAIALTTASEFPILGALNFGILNFSFPDGITCGQDDFEYDAGVWYSVLGTGSAFTVSICFDEYYPPSLLIFSGTCDELDCVAVGVGANVSAVCELSTYGNHAGFQTEVDKQYFIYVAAYLYGFDTGFELSISEIELAPNTLCSDAIELLPDTETKTGSVINAITSLPTSNSPCVITSSGSVWYSLMGTGDVFIISTCSEELSFYSAIAVSNGSCDNQECVTSGDYNDFGCNLTVFGAAKVVFKSEVDVPYNVLVQQSVYDEGIGGDFRLTVTSVQVPPNMFCSSSVLVEPDHGTVTGWIRNVTGVMGGTTFSYPYETVGGWYSLVGTGSDYEITTCYQHLNFDSAIRIFTGTCDYPQMIMSVAENDHGCTDRPNSNIGAARAVLSTEPGVTYRILVEAVRGVTGDDKGEFGLTIFKVKVCPMYYCSGARVLDLNHNISIHGFLADATEFPDIKYDCTPSKDAPSAWYTWLGTGGIYAFSTCSRELNFDSVMSVSTGSCESQQCTKFNSSIDQACSVSDYVASRVVVYTEIGVEYWIAIQGLNVTNATGAQFVLTISSVLPSLDDLTEEDHALHSELGNSSALPQGSGLDRRHPLPSLLVTISIGLWPWMMNLWCS